MTPLDIIHGIALALVAAIVTAFVIVARPWTGWLSRSETRDFAIGAAQGLVVAVIAVGGAL